MTKRLKLEPLTFDVYVVPPEESAKCDLDPMYTPKEVMVGTIKAQGEGQAYRKASKFWNCPYLVEHGRDGA